MAGFLVITVPSKKQNANWHVTGGALKMKIGSTAFASSGCFTEYSTAA